MFDYFKIIISASLIAFAYNFALGISGHLICRVGLGESWKKEFSSKVTPLILCIALGQAIMGSIWQLLAAWGGFHLEIVILLMAGISLGWLWYFRQSIHKLRLDFSSLTWKCHRLSSYCWMLLIVALVVLTIIWMRSFGWPDGDAMAFYMAQPKLIAFTGEFTPLADYERFAEIGLYAEMHSAVMYLLQGEMGVRAFLLQSGVLLILAVAALCIETGLSMEAAIISAIILLTSTSLFFVVATGKTDHVGTFWAISSFILILKVDWSAPWRFVFFTGLLGGISCLAKLSFLAGVPVVLAFITIVRFWMSEHNFFIKQFSTRLCLIACVGTLGFLVALSTLFIKNYVVYGQPLAPFLYLGGGSSSMLTQVWFSPENTKWILLTYPIALVFGKYPMQAGNLSPLIIVFLPMAFWAVKKGFKPDPMLIILCVAGLLTVGIWMVFRPSVLAPRYIFPILFCIIPLLAGSAEFWFRQEGNRYAVWFVVILISIHTCCIGYKYHYPWAMTKLYATGQKPDALLVAGDQLSAGACPDARFMVACYYKSFLKPQVLLKTIGAKEKANLKKLNPNSSAEMWDILYSNGVTDIMIYTLTHPTLLGIVPNPDDISENLKVTEEVISPIISIFRIRKYSDCINQDNDGC